MKRFIYDWPWIGPIVIGLNAKWKSGKFTFPPLELLKGEKTTPKNCMLNHRMNGFLTSATDAK